MGVSPGRRRHHGLPAARRAGPRPARRRPRGIDARRTDILTDLLLGRDLPGAAQTTVEVQINLDAATLTGLANNSGHLAGFGSIPAQMARDLATAAQRWGAPP